MPTIGSRRSTSPTGFRGLVPAPDRPGTYASARPRHDHDLTTETAPRILPGPSLTPSTTGGDASGGSGWGNILGGCPRIPLRNSYVLAIKCRADFKPK